MMKPAKIWNCPSVSKVKVNDDDDNEFSFGKTVEGVAEFERRKNEVEGIRIRSLKGIDLVSFGMTEAGEARFGRRRKEVKDISISIRSFDWNESHGGGIKIKHASIGTAPVDVNADQKPMTKKRKLETKTKDCRQYRQDNCEVPDLRAMESLKFNTFQKITLTLPQPHNTHGPKSKAASTASAQASMSSPAASSDANSTTNTPTAGEKSSQSDVKPSSKELNTYMDKWVATHAPINLMPSLKQKETIIEETGVDKKRLESWFYRARKKMKRNPPPVTKAYSDLLNAATQAQAPSTTDSSAMEIDNANNPSIMSKGNVTNHSE
eukprot:scaffold5681_cov151-Skeletonema_marinoi.AAC.4